MKALLHAWVAVAATGMVLATAPVAFAQNSPGVPGGILNDQFRLAEHPQMPFAASAPTDKYQSNKKSAMRKRGDNGDPNGCNLQCPKDE
ncbi:MULTISPECIES: hypothetical protein [Paraburkholderia]|uniref:Uncharacterized protein n=2 Tax=Paraburkholderia TaxID=1822464 RepID=A0A7Y9W385_9BURK|nr:hypothetical protein [Paraburkholderia bryophila]NYH13467.1 hypothetical protein [Paraburkholderia bryophila]NYH24032.1 hypothetical protein [Paraburkholderia bryophila]